MGQDAEITSNKYANQAHSRILRRLLSFTIVGIVVHWFFQGLLYMDRTERIFKISFDVILTLFLGPIFDTWLPWQAAWPAALLTAHTLNFLLNAQFWVVMKVYGKVHISFEDFELYKEGVIERLKSHACFRYGAIYGSYVRGEWNPCSDLDLRLVRKPGFLNGLRSCSIVLTERLRALVSGFPLDVYVLDSELRLHSMKASEKPVIIFQNQI